MELMEKVINVAVAIIRRDDKFLIAERGPTTYMAGKWEFPGGKVEDGEIAEECVKREVLEELDADVIVGELFHTVLYDYPEKGLMRVYGFLCTLTGREPKAGHAHAKFLWVTAPELKKYDFLPADILIIERLLLLEA
ncbi:MAG: (deoxy)nucleoside triphosphate pyrophosphohydrolase [bacterium]|nr:(deoxy)nucleoside triphosphate pyrophosphohydrolase [bacterium]